MIPRGSTAGGVLQSCPRRFRGRPTVIIIRGFSGSKRLKFRTQSAGSSASWLCGVALLDWFSLLTARFHPARASRIAKVKMNRPDYQEGRRYSHAEMSPTAERGAKVENVRSAGHKPLHSPGPKKGECVGKSKLLSGVDPSEFPDKTKERRLYA